MNTALTKLHPNLVRSLSAVSLHKAVQIAGLVVTVVLVPRLFGAEAYGRFAFVLSLSYLGQVLGDFGTLDVMGRFVPGLAPAEAGRLYMRHLAFKLGVGVLCGLITVGAALALGPWMRLDWALLTGLGVALHIVAWVPFQFSLGLNRVGLGLGGALVAVVLMEFLFCGLGLWSVRDYWQPAELRFDWHYLRPYVRFGFGFFLANLATVALYRSGPLVVETLTGQSTQTGYFNLALGLFLLAYATTSQFAQSLIPSLSDFYDQGQAEKMQGWLQSFGRYGWLIGWLGVVAVWLVADWAVPFVFGADFGPAAVGLRWISLGIPLAALLWAGNVTATVTGRGSVKFGASVASLLVFGVVALWLVPLYGAVGASLALVLAGVANIVILMAYLYPNFAPNWLMLLSTGVAGALLLAGLMWFK
jgi:O-antigen/teichoic acid export membrane protein